MGSNNKDKKNTEDAKYPIDNMMKFLLKIKGIVLELEKKILLMIYQLYFQKKRKYCIICKFDKKSS